MPWLQALLATVQQGTTSWINSGYGIVSIVVGVVTVVTSGTAAYKIAQRRGVEAKQTKQVIDIVLPDDKGQGGVQAAIRELGAKIDALAVNQTPNGGNTKSLGDTMVRIETGLEKLNTKVDQHIGSVNTRLTAIEGQLREVKSAKGP